ncbi:MAG: hypothetical protein ACI4EG_14975 [Fusicatenibacter sp.]
MSRYDVLWQYVADNGQNNFKLTYDEIEEIAGVPIDHSFLTYKKELLAYGFRVGKISMKEQTVEFLKEQ